MHSILFRASVISVILLMVPISTVVADDGHPELGMATGFGALRGRPTLELDAEFADYAALGLTWLRTDLYWSNIQPAGPYSYDWSEFDRVVTLAQANGLKVLPVVGTTPPWARSDPERRSAPADPADFGRFMAEAVRRYAPQGIRAWEIWNEPNLASFFPPEPDPDAYARLLIAAHAAIKSNDPDAVVISGGLSPVPKTNILGSITHFAAVDFLDAVYAAGAGDAFDAVGFHPYAFPRMPSDPVSWTGWSLMLGPIRAIMKMNGDATKPIWITEFGAPSNSDKSKVSEPQQAAMLSEAIELVKGYYWASSFFWYSYRDLGTDPDDNEHWFGLLRKDGSRKKSYDALRAVAGRAVE